MASIVAMSFDERLAPPYNGSGFIQNDHELILGSLTLYSEHESGIRFDGKEFTCRQVFTLDTSDNGTVSVDHIELYHMIYIGFHDQRALIRSLNEVAFQLIKKPEEPTLYWGNRGMIWFPGKELFEVFSQAKVRTFETQCSDGALWRLSWS